VSRPSGGIAERGRAASIRAARAALLVGLLAGLVGCPSKEATTASELSPATTAHASFALIRRAEQLLILNAAGEIPVPIDGDADPFGASSSTAEAIDGETVALIDRGRLVTVRHDGSAQSVPCVRCNSVIWSGEDLVVLSESLSAGRTFDLTRFNRELEPKTTITLRRQTERTDPNYERNEVGVIALAANSNTVWAAYTDRFGFARGGSRTIAAYDNDGNLVRSTRVPGSIYASSVSDDGRFLAVADGGSGGACITASEVDVINLTTMRSLDTSPRIPIQAVLETPPEDVPSLNFAAFDLHWRGGSAVAIGETSRGNDPEGQGSCDPQATRWVRTFDTATQIFTDTKADVDPGSYIGPTCLHRLRSSTTSNDWQLTTGPGQTRAVEMDSLIYHPPLPPECGESA